MTKQRSIIVLTGEATVNYDGALYIDGNGVGRVIGENWPIRLLGDESYGLVKLIIEPIDEIEVVETAHLLDR